MPTDKQGSLDISLESAMSGRRAKYAYYIKDLKSGAEYSRGAQTSVPSASLIKLVVMGEILRRVREGSLSLGQRISIQESSKVPFSVITLLDTGNTYTLADVITLMIVQSDNTAANILIEMAGMGKVDEFSIGLGLKDTKLRRLMMDFEARKLGRENYTSAADMGLFLDALYNKRIVDESSSDWMLGIMKKQLDTSMMMLHIPDETVVAHKTGELDCLDHEAAIVFTDKADYIFVALVWDAPSNNIARLALGDMSKAAYDFFIER